MSTPFIQPSFSAGALAPQLQARVDLTQFHSGAAYAYNLYVDYRGGLTSRPGTKLVAVAGSQDLTYRVRLIKFQFSVLQTYELEFGDHYMRVIKNGGIVTSGGIPYVLATPWAGADVRLLKFAQSNDVMTICHPSYPPQDLARLADNNWTLTPVSFASTLVPPAINSLGRSYALPSGAPTYQESFFYDYVSTIVDRKGIESQPSAHSYIRTFSFEDVRQTILIGCTYNPNAAYYNFYKARSWIATSGSSGLTEFPPSAPAYGYIGSSEGVSLSDANIVPDFSKTPPKHRDPFAIRGITSVTIGSQGSGYRGKDTIVVSDSTGTGAVIIPVFSPGGTLIGAQIQDPGSNYTNPTLTVATMTGTGALMSVTLGPGFNTYPGVVTYFQQRKVFAASINQPSTYWATRNGQFNNMDVSLPQQDNDALTFTLASLEQNPIKYMIPMQNGLVILTGGSAWLVSGGDNNTALTPTAVKQTPQVYNGTADVLPLVIGYNILYVQEKEYVVQDIKFDFFSNVYTGEDRTYLSSQLFEGRSVVDWCWSEQPSKLVWVVMSDGKLISMTYIPEQKIYGWTEHETAGFVESISCCTEGREDAVYIVVRRATGRFIERFQNRVGWSTTADSWTLDSALQYVGPPAQDMTGLDHLIGQQVDVIADGEYLGLMTVSGAGTVTLTVAASTVLIGLGYETKFRSMYLDAQTSPTPQGRRKLNTAATLRLVGSKGVLAGRTFDTLVPVKDTAAPGDIALRTEDQRCILETGWETNGQICLQGSRGLPWSLTAIIPEGWFGD